MLILSILLLAAPVVVAFVLLVSGRETRKLLIRFLSGAVLAGGFHTDATFLKHPTAVKHPRGRLEPHWWHWRPGWHRGAARVAAVYATELAAAGLIFETGVMLIVFVVLGAAGVVWAGWKTYRKVHRWWPSNS